MKSLLLSEVMHLHLNHSIKSSSLKENFDYLIQSIKNRVFFFYLYIKLKVIGGKRGNIAVVKTEKIFDTFNQETGVLFKTADYIEKKVFIILESKITPTADYDDNLPFSGNYKNYTQRYFIHNLKTRCVEEVEWNYNNVTQPYWDRFRKLYNKCNENAIDRILAS